MKCIEFEFPSERSDQIWQYKSKEKYKRDIEDYCDQILGDRYVFKYSCYDRDKDSVHTWRCHDCDAYLKFQKIGQQYELRDLCTTHIHPLKMFQNCSLQLFDRKVKPKDIPIKQQFFLPYKVVVAHQIQGLKNLLRVQWQKCYPQRPVPKLESAFMHNMAYIICKQYRQREKPKCPFKLVYQQIKQAPHLYQLQTELTQVCHKHLLTHLKQIKQRDQFSEDEGQKKGRRKKDSSLLNNYFFDYQTNGTLRSIFQNLRSLIQEVKQLGFQILIPTPETQTKQDKNEGNAEQVKNNHVDQDDYFLVTNRACKFLYRSYAVTMFVSRIFLSQGNAPQLSYSGFCFHGFNFKFQSVFFCIAICQNINKKKIKDIIRFFYQYFQLKQNTLVIDHADIQLEEALAQMKVELNNICIHKSYYKKQNDTDLIDAQAKFLSKINVTPFENVAKVSLIERPKYQYLKYSNNRNQFLGLTDCLINPQKKVAKLDYFLKYEKPEGPEVSPVQNILKASKTFKKICILVNEKNRAWKLIQRERQICYEKFYQYPVIKRWRVIMARKPFLVLIRQFEKMRSCSISISCSPYFYMVEDHRYSYIVSQSSQTQKWSCECGYKVRTGIPCCHLLRVLIQQKQAIIKQINKFWVVDEGLMNVLSPTVPVKRKVRSRSKLTFLNHTHY